MKQRPDLSLLIDDALGNVIDTYMRDEAKDFLEHPSDTHILHSLKAIYLWAFTDCELDDHVDAAVFAKCFLGIEGDEQRELNKRMHARALRLIDDAVEAEFDQAMAEYCETHDLPYPSKQ